MYCKHLGFGDIFFGLSCPELHFLLIQNSPKRKGMNPQFDAFLRDAVKVYQSVGRQTLEHTVHDVPGNVIKIDHGL